MILLPNITPYGRWQPLGCQWCNKRPLGGGMPHSHYTGFGHRTFSHASDPRIYRSSNRRRHWLWPGHCRPVQRHPEPRESSYAELSQSSSNAQPHWWPSMGMMLWKPPCWGCWGGTETTSHSGRGYFPPGQKRWALRSARPCFLTSRNPQICKTWWADYHSCYFHCTQQSPFLEKKGSHGKGMM